MLIEHFAITKWASRRFCDASRRSGLLERLPIPTEKHPRARESRFRLLKADPYHPSLHFKKIGDLWSVRVGIHHRALGVDVEGGVLWLWIGTHANTTGLRGKLRGRAYRLDHFNERVFALKLLSQRWSDRWSKTHTLAASAFRAGAA